MQKFSNVLTTSIMEDLCLAARYRDWLYTAPKFESEYRPSWPMKMLTDYLMRKMPIMISSCLIVKSSTARFCGWRM